MILSDKSREELRWWSDNVDKKNGKRIRPDKVLVTCRSDASFLGWGIMMFPQVNRQMVDGQNKNLLFLSITWS